MPYIGRELTAGNYLKLDDISSQFNGSTTTFNLTSGGQAFFPGSAFSILVSVAGVIQEANSAYEINNSQIVFAQAPGPTDNFFCVVLGLALGVGVPADGSVGVDQLSPTARDNLGATEYKKDGTVVGSAVTVVNYIGADNQFSYNAGARSLDVTITSGVGIQSSGSAVGTGVTQINFVGTGNTFAYNAGTNTVDVSINVAAGGTWSNTTAGIHTTKIIGVNTTASVGTANSEGAVQAHGNIAIVDGALTIDSTVDNSITVPSGRNGLLIGPTTVAIGVTIDVAQGSTLVVV
jgi:hypothetical protein|tara:strand:- start:757 stop:1629 length:873 start_codon:yes stop_codon:yes gene_type:complete